jgi:hypothetical protein
MFFDILWVFYGPQPSSSPELQDVLSVHSWMEKSTTYEILAYQWSIFAFSGLFLKPSGLLDSDLGWKTKMILTAAILQLYNWLHLRISDLLIPVRIRASL